MAQNYGDAPVFTNYEQIGSSNCMVKARSPGIPAGFFGRLTPRRQKTDRTIDASCLFVRNAEYGMPGPLHITFTESGAGS